MTEGSVSKWIGGKEAMKTGRLHEIAAILGMKAGDLIGEPPGDYIAKPVSELLDAVDGLDAEAISRIAAMVRAYRGQP